MRALQISPEDSVATLIDPAAAGDRATLEGYIRSTVGGWYHPTGTCRMGSDPDDGAVVDGRLAVHGVDVVDHVPQLGERPARGAHRGGLVRPRRRDPGPDDRDHERRDADHDRRGPDAGRPGRDLGSVSAWSFRFRVDDGRRR